MKQYRNSAFFIIIALLLLASPHPARADQQWHYQAAAQVSQPGLIETVLPAGVFFGTDNAVKTSRDHIPVGLGQPMKYHRNDEIRTDKHPLAVTIQSADKDRVYGNRVRRLILQA